MLPDMKSASLWQIWLFQEKIWTWFYMGQDRPREFCSPLLWLLVYCIWGDLLGLSSTHSILPLSSCIPELPWSRDCLRLCVRAEGDGGVCRLDPFMSSHKKLFFEMGSVWCSTVPPSSGWGSARMEKARRGVSSEWACRRTVLLFWPQPSFPSLPCLVWNATAEALWGSRRKPPMNLHWDKRERWCSSVLSTVQTFGWNTVWAFTFNLRAVCFSFFWCSKEKKI